MTAAADPAAVFDHDPDVLQAIEDLGPTAARLRQIEQQILDTDENAHWRRFNGLRAAAGQCRDAIALRAQSRLRIGGAALELLLNEEARLRKAHGRRPTRDMIRRSLADLAGSTADARETARSRAKVAAVEARAAERQADAAEAAYKAFRGDAAHG